MITIYDILKLKKQLLPTGRAFRVPEKGVFEKIYLSLAKSEKDLYDSTIKILSGLIPDNDDFDELDCVKWESILGIYSELNDTLEKRKLAIKRKMSVKSLYGMQHKLYLQKQLYDAGFDVNIYEYHDIVNQKKILQYSSKRRYGAGYRYGGFVMPSYSDIISSQLKLEDEVQFTPTDEQLKSCFWIAGATVNDSIYIPTARMTEFRNIILSIKPLYSVGFMRLQAYPTDWILQIGLWNNLGHFYNTAIWKSV